MCFWSLQIHFFYLFISNDIGFTAKLISLSSGHTRQYENIIQTQSINLQLFYETSTGLRLQLVRCVGLKLLLAFEDVTLDPDFYDFAKCSFGLVRAITL